METKIGHLVVFGGMQYKIVGELGDLWVIVPNTGLWPQQAVLIPKEPSK